MAACSYLRRLASCWPTDIRGSACNPQRAASSSAVESIHHRAARERSISDMDRHRAARYTYVSTADELLLAAARRRRPRASAASSSTAVEDATTPSPSKVISMLRTGSMRRYNPCTDLPDRRKHVDRRLNRQSTCCGDSKKVNRRNCQITT